MKNNIKETVVSGQSNSSSSYSNSSTHHSEEGPALALLKDVVSALEEGFALYDADMRFLLCNDKYLDLAYPSNSLPPQVGQPALEIATIAFSSDQFSIPESIPFDTVIKEAIEFIRTYGKEMELERLDGRTVLASSNKTSLGGYLITILDITERKRAEQAEREAANLLHQVVEACPANFLMSRMEDGEVLYRSPASKELFGQKPSARGHWDNPEDRLIYLEALKRNGRVDDMFVLGLKADGTAFPSQVSARLIDYKGEKAIVSSTTDLTDIFAMRDERNRANARLRDAIEALAEGFVLYDQNECFVMANARYRKMLAPYAHLMKPGTPMEKITGQAIRDGHVTIISEPQNSISDILNSVSNNGSSQIEIKIADESHQIVTVAKLDDGGLVATAVDITDKLKAEQLLTDAISRLPVGVAVETPDGKITHCNAAFASFYDRPRDELLTLSFEERMAIIYPSIATFNGKAIEGDPMEVHRKSGSSQHDSLAPIEASLKDGRHYLLERAATHDGGRVVVMTDITDLKEAEAESLAAVTDAIQALDEGLALFDSDLNLVMANRRWYEIFFRDLASPEIGENAVDMMEQLIGMGFYNIPEGISDQQYVDGMIKLVRSYAKKIPLETTDGRIMVASVHETGLGGYLLAFTDITEQRRAEEEQQEADMLLRKIVEACPANFLVSRVIDGKIIYCPPTSRERFGNIDSTLSFFLTPEDRTKYLDALLPSGTLDDYRVQFRRKDGSIMQGLTAARVTDYKGEDVIVSSTRDISDQLAMQAELVRQREITHQNEKLSALGELLASVAHELNNPLSIVVGYAQMLEGKFDDPVLQKRVGRIAQAADRSAKIVKTFLAMARQRPIRIEKCSLNDVVAMALDVAGYGLRSNGTEIILDLDEDLPLISGDADQLAQVFTNLIINAEHALAEKKQDGKLILRSYHDAETDHSAIEVRDNGEGIPDDIQARIFEPFFTTKDVGTGTGIGLAFSHRIIDTHGGLLTLKSEVGKGTSFFVQLKTSKEEFPKLDKEPAPLPAQQNCNILVVDDEDDVAELILDVLQENGNAVTISTNAREALTLLSERHFDAVLSDFKMPGLDGEGFFQIIQEEMPDYAERIGFITGDAMSTKAAQFFRQTRRPHIEKPITAPDLIELIDILCSRSNGETG